MPGFTSIPTPFGLALCVTTSERGIVRSVFVRDERAELRAFEDEHGRPNRRDPTAREAARAVRAYFAKRATVFDIPLALDGTPLQIAAWRAVSRLPFGALVSYADVARGIGFPGAHRAVARAMRETPLALFVPAHRVVGSDGTVKGAARNSMRRKLLLFEGHRELARR